MGKHKGKRLWPDPAGMDEVNVEAVDPGMELRELIDEPFPFFPIEAGEPVVMEAAQVREISAVSPVGSRNFVRPPRPTQPRGEIL
jgi:hypothetical protein